MGTWSGLPLLRGERGGTKSPPAGMPPDPRPSRNETIGMFIQWVKDHPQYWGELPVETEFVS